MLVPCAQPAFGKKPFASAQQRLEMLSLTVQYEGGLSVDDREIRRGGTTYTVETLEDLRREYPDDALVWVMGDDVLGSLQDWHRWERLFELAHLLVLERSGRTNLLDGAVSSVIQASECADVETLCAAPAGRVLYLPDAHPKVSSSAVRSGVQRDAVPDMVRDYIERTGLYRQQSADETAS
ncbi:MAG: nicotinate-nicotinamide nucleotide adenylyltransferase [Gammaproteobacteria bacterium AqS3]|nr:nicotinate-nicotinamide nucleotide adenylyltransferase [Gammaproteobacteria bacterium AqS3]